MGPEEVASRMRRGVEYLHDLVFSPECISQRCVSVSCGFLAFLYPFRFRCDLSLWSIRFVLLLQHPVSPMSLDSNIYLAVTLARTSPFYANPSGLLVYQFAVNYVGNVGQLSDVQLFSVPKVVWDSRQQDILSFLKGSEGVQRVDVQSPKTRSKRDEL